MTLKMDAGSFSQKIKIKNKKGLHARASARFAQIAGEYDAEITVEKDGVKVPGNSIMGLMMLAASPDSYITIQAIGNEAEEALNSLVSLVKNRFDEE
ncbi:MAG: HPr family phosphocarrier protein [Alphaproteobacteria bacterium]|nr:HPr family phosphocarrier protein [Alphaproteobacteria bacterium]